MTRGYKAYALILMTAVYTLNFVDRALMQLLLEPIKRDLQLSDTQMGFVTGIAFALFYATAGLPLARLADRGNRSKLAAAAIGIWGLTVMGGLFITNYLQLVLARVLAAVGEAGCKPPTYSLVGDYFPRPAERARAMSIYWLASPLAALTGFVAGGWLADHYGWRMTFFIMGIPGVFLALIVWLTLKEPREFADRRESAVPSSQPPLRSAFAAIWRQQSARNLSIALVLFYTLGYGMNPWYGAFLIRTYAMPTSELGLWFGLIQGFAGLTGILVGGQMASRWFADDERKQMRVTGAMVALLVPLLGAFLFAPSKQLSLMFMFPFQVLLNFFFAPTYALLQRLVADEVRATTLAIVTMLAHLIGMGLGPQLVGIFSDLFAPSMGANSLRYAMMAVSLAAFWSAFHFWRAGRSVREDLSSVAKHQAARV